MEIFDVMGSANSFSWSLQHYTNYNFELQADFDFLRKMLQINICKGDGELAACKTWINICERKIFMPWLNP